MSTDDSKNVSTANGATFRYIQIIADWRHGYEGDFTGLLVDSWLPVFLVPCILLIWFCGRVTCVGVCVHIFSLTKPSCLIMLDRCYYIEMSTVMYASVMWTCQIVLDGTWRFLLSWRVLEKNKVPTLCLKYCSRGTAKRPHQITRRHCWKVTRHILKFSRSANKSDVSSI